MLFIACELTQSRKHGHLTYGQISLPYHTDGHVASRDWWLTFCCPDLPGRQLSHLVTAHWVSFVVCQDTNSNLKIGKRTRQRAWNQEMCIKLSSESSVVQKRDKINGPFILKLKKPKKPHSTELCSCSHGYSLHFGRRTKQQTVRGSTDQTILFVIGI